jgi:Flp pilus assembly protein TadD
MRGVPLLLLGMLAVLAGEARAQSDQPANRGQASRWCIGPRGVSDAQIIAGCGWLIANGPVAGGNLLAAYRGRGLALARGGQFGAAAADLGKAVELEPRDTSLRQVQAFVLFLDGQPDAAIPVLTALLSLKPGDPAALELRAMAASDARRLDMALADIDEAIRLSPQKHALLTVRAIVLIRRGDRQAATRDLDLHVAFEPDDADALLNRALNRVALGDFRGALGDASVVPAQDTAREMRLATRCLARWRLAAEGWQTDCDAARAPGRGAAANGWPWAAGGGIALAEGRPAEALAILDEGLAHRPHDAFTRWLRGVARLRLGRDGADDLSSGIVGEPLSRLLAREYFGEAILPLP